MSTVKQLDETKSDRKNSFRKIELEKQTWTQENIDLIFLVALLAILILIGIAFT